jgi:hypothetical protein
LASSNRSARAAAATSTRPLFFRMVNDGPYIDEELN